MTDTLRVALAQLEVARDPEQNLAQVLDRTRQARERGARLVVLPEGIVSRDADDPDATAAGAQPLDGPFVTGMLEASRDGVAIAATVHVRQPDGRTLNVGLVCDGGEIVARYDKLHLYDAFSARESDRVTPGTVLPEPFELDGFRFGLMTCYDVRFPELARALTVAGADALLLPAAWVRGPLKEDHWRTMITARALENTVYVLASGEASRRNIGLSMAVDPLGVTIASAGEAPDLVVADLDRSRIEHA
ncbi:hydrolase, partial [Auraticoccus sp. F435]